MCAVTIVLTFLAMSCTAFAQSTGGTTPDSTNASGFDVRLRSVQIDGVTLFFVNTLGLSVDIDLTGRQASAFGIRGGADAIWLGVNCFECGAHHEYLDYNLLARYTARSSVMRLDLIGGYSLRTGLYERLFPPIDHNLKFGAEMRLIKAGKQMPLVIKFLVCPFAREAPGRLSTLGVGLVLGYEP